MAITTTYTLPKKRNLEGLGYAMSGQQPAFGAPPAPPKPYLPTDYGYGDLATYEEQRRNAFGDSSSADILKTRDNISSSLNDYGKKFFAQQNPAILEDLNSRGLLTSESARANAEAQALKEIELENSKYLRDFDTSALSARLQAQQDALDSGLDLRRGGLEQANENAAANKEEALARDLAKQSKRNQMTGSLIGAGGSLLAAGLSPGGFLRGTGSLFSGGGAAGGAAGSAGAAGAAGATGAGAGGIPLASAGTAAPAGIGLGGGLAIGGAGIGAAMLSRAAQKKAGGGVKGTAAGIAANPIGYQINKAKELISNPSKTIKKAFGGGGNTASQQAGIDFGASEDPETNEILQSINSKGQNGTFNEGQIKEAADQGIKLYNQYRDGQISREDYLRKAEAFVPTAFERFAGYMGSGGAGASAFNKSGIEYYMNKAKQKYDKVLQDPNYRG